MIGARRPHRITVFHPTGYDAVGAPTGTTAENVPCLIEYGNKLIRGPTGDQIVSRAQITTTHPVQAGDTVTLPGETSGQTVIDVRPVTDLGGRECDREVYL